ncbi:transcriptional regulator, GntR family [Burkholderia sp. D7]|nr:transcriptional regulator, GntR family [Burkholderia sp. D7]
MSVPPDFLHVSLASRLMGEIERGLWAEGQRLPSVREMSRRCAVSVTTILAAYRALEDRQVIESRPQKGFYVCPNGSRLAEPFPASAAIAETESSHTALRYMDDAAHTVSFGTALCDKALFPVVALSRSIARAARAHSALLTDVSFSSGSRRLRESLAAHAKTWNCHLSADEVLVTNGCIEAFGLCLQAVARGGDVIVVESPAYYGFLSTIAQLGMLAVALPFHDDPDRSIAEIERLSRRRRVGACLLSTTVSNPVGASMDDETKQRLVDALERLQIPLIEDATFSDLHFEAKQRAAKSYDRNGNVLLCSSLTKTLAPGLRLGWVSGGRHHERIVSLKRTMSVGQPLLIQEAVGDYLTGGGYQHHLRQLRNQCRLHVVETLEVTKSEFGPEIEVGMPSGGYLLWLRLPNEVSSAALYRRALGEGISIAPGTLFSPAGAFSDYVRLNCGFPMTDSRRDALARLGRMVRELQRLPG